MATLVLEKHHIIYVNDVLCITLGHNYTYDILEHPFFGTYYVIQFLNHQNGWKTGHIQFQDIYQLGYIQENSNPRKSFGYSHFCRHLRER